MAKGPEEPQQEQGFVANAEQEQEQEMALEGGRIEESTSFVSLKKKSENKNAQEEDEDLLFLFPFLWEQPKVAEQPVVVQYVQEDCCIVALHES